MNVQAVESDAVCDFNNGAQTSDSSSQVHFHVAPQQAGPFHTWRLGEMDSLNAHAQKAFQLTDTQNLAKPAGIRLAEHHINGIKLCHNNGGSLEIITGTNQRSHRHRLKSPALP